MNNRQHHIVFALSVLFVLLISRTLYAQTQTDRSLITPRDSNAVFEPRQPLVLSAKERLSTSALGFEVLFSRSGFGLGFFYQRSFSPTLTGFINLGITGAQNTDENEVYDSFIGWFVPNKENRLFSLPLMAGANMRLFPETFSDSFQPIFQAGIGVSTIISTPYYRDKEGADRFPREFFSSFSDAKFYVRPGGFIGIGATSGDTRKVTTSGYLRYYYIPFGGDGLESIAGSPIQNFGGIFLSMTVSWSW